MDVLVAKRQHFKCFENLIAYIAQKYDLRYEVMFARMWDFQFSLNNKNELVSKRLNGNFKLAEDYLKEFSGLEFFTEERVSNTFVDLCDKEVAEGRDVIIPSFDQNILKKYRKVDKKPSTVLLLVDIVEDMFCCVDIHGEVGENGYAKIVEIGKGDFLQGSKENGYNVGVTYKIEKNVSSSPPRELLDRQINRLLKKDRNGYNVFQKMKVFAGEINENTVRREVYADISAEQYPFFEKIKEICRGRFLFSYFLKMLASKGYSFLADCAEEMNGVGTYWNKIMSLLLKMYYKKNFTYAEKISNMVEGVAILEEQLAQKIQLYLEAGDSP